MKWEKLIVFMTFFLIIAIASINIYFSLTMLVIDKKKDIATLHALGASKKVIRKVFLSVGLIIAFTGASLGLALGLMISGLQQEYGFVSMGMQSALMTAYPVIISISDVFLTAFAIIIITLLATIQPAILATKNLSPQSWALLILLWNNFLTLEVLFQQKLSNNFYGILAYTLFSSEFSGIDNVRLPSVWDSGNLLTFTGGYKLPKNWEVSLRYRYAGATPFAPTDTAATLITYPQVIIDYSRLGENKLSTFKQGDFRLDKKWNFEKLSFNFYIEIQNFLAQENPRPDEYTLARTDEGVLILPKELVKIEREERNTPFPSFGFVFDF